MDGSTDGTTDGQVDGTTDGTTDGNVDGTTDGTTDGQVDGTTDGSTGGTGSEVLGRVIHKKPLATTGSATTTMAWIGMAMLMVGVTLRYRFGVPDAYAAAADAPSKDDKLTRAQRARSRDWTCGG